MYLVYAQRNVPGRSAVPWAGQRLGTCTGITIGSDGCYVSAMAQVATHYEHPINPGQMDDQLTNRGFYTQGCLMLDNNLQRVFPDLIYRGTRGFAGPADLSSLLMADDEEKIIGLDTQGKGQTVRHFARVFDYNPKTGVVLIDDPWWGVTLDFRSKYGDPKINIMKVVTYQKPGWVPPWKRTAPAPAPAPAPVPVPVPVPAPAPIISQEQLDAFIAENADLKIRLAQSASVVDSLTGKLNLDEAAIAFAVQSLQQRKGA